MKSIFTSILVLFGFLGSLSAQAYGDRDNGCKDQPEEVVRVILKCFDRDKKNAYEVLSNETYGYICLRTSAFHKRSNNNFTRFYGYGLHKQDNEYDYYQLADESGVLLDIVKTKGTDEAYRFKNVGPDDKIGSKMYSKGLWCKKF